MSVSFCVYWWYFSKNLFIHLRCQNCINLSIIFFIVFLMYMRSVAILCFSFYFHLFLLVGG